MLTRKKFQLIAKQSMMRRQIKEAPFLEEVEKDSEKKQPTTTFKDNI